jgi:sortase (surface protein transpeptidase)
VFGLKRHTKQVQRQSASRRLPWRTSKKTIVAKGQRRAKTISVPKLGGTKIEFKFRYFRTLKSSQSKLNRQFVFRVPLLPVREIVISELRRSGKPVPRRRRNPIVRLKPRWQTSALASASLIIGMTGILYFALNLKKPVDLPPPILTSAAPLTFQKPAPKDDLKNTLPESEPTTVRVPKVGINAGLLPMGTNPDGTMETPKTNVLAGWYKNAPTPGEMGPSILVGHVDSAKEGPAVFFRLRELIPGDIIEVDRKDGKVAKFRVDSVEQFQQDAFPTQKVYGNIDHAGIRLITCGGEFDRKAHKYLSNTVVFGTLVN